MFCIIHFELFSSQTSTDTVLLVFTLFQSSFVFSTNINQHYVCQTSAYLLSCCLVEVKTTYLSLHEN